jgi:hypothetical protein
MAKFSGAWMREQRPLKGNWVPEWNFATALGLGFRVSAGSERSYKKGAEAPLNKTLPCLNHENGKQLHEGLQHR